MTGAEKGACESVSGTPYVGSDQVAQACPATAAAAVLSRAISNNASKSSLLMPSVMEIPAAEMPQPTVRCQ